MEGGREIDKEGERRERRDGKKEIRGKGRACSRGEEWRSNYKRKMMVHGGRSSDVAFPSSHITVWWSVACSHSFFVWQQWLCRSNIRCHWADDHLVIGDREAEPSDWLRSELRRCPVTVGAAARWLDSESEKWQLIRCMRLFLSRCPWICQLWLNIIRDALNLETQWDTMERQLQRSACIASSFDTLNWFYCGFGRRQGGVSNPKHDSV